MRIVCIHALFTGKGTFSAICTSVFAGELGDAPVVPPGPGVRVDEGKVVNGVVTFGEIEEKGAGGVNLLI